MRYNAFHSVYFNKLLPCLLFKDEAKHFPDSQFRLNCECTLGKSRKKKDVRHADIFYQVLSQEIETDRQFKAEEHRYQQEYCKQDPEQCHWLLFFTAYQYHFHHTDCQYAEQEFNPVLHRVCRRPFDKQRKSGNDDQNVE